MKQNLKAGRSNFAVRAILWSMKRVTLRRESPYGKLVVSGCAVSTGEAGAASDLGIDLLVDNSKKKELVKTVTDTLPISIMPEGATLPAESALFARNRQRAFIKIQDGCRYRCTYCIVTMARGEEQSRPLNDIVYSKY